MSRRKRLQSYLEYLLILSRYRKQLDPIESYVGFIGYPRSGHSLIGSILDAHPHVIISHELDVLGKLQRNWTRNRVFCEILKNSFSHAKKGRSQTGYSYDVPNQYQGCFETLKVIGDNKGGKSTIRLQQDPNLIESLEVVINKPVKLTAVLNGSCGVPPPGAHHTKGFSRRDPYN
ncbi:hypothetical protein [Prochlorothrix hollandica]|uniref:hypothetical protein n=1 Tax=Prochlorothrix hollandica TaxID=1223 RepID=UPI0011D26C29|nr:hypothetical protein [Prochlorothrix hollandica]